MTRDIHFTANAMPSTGFHPETTFLTQQKHLTPQNKTLAPHCGRRSVTPLVKDQLSGVTEGSSQMNAWPAAQMSPGAKTIKKNTNSTQNKSQTHRAKQYEVTSFLSTDCELSTETCSKNVYSAERTMAGHGENVAALAYRCM